MTDIAGALQLIDCVPDPLLSGVALARTIDSSTMRLDLLESIVSRYGERPDARTLQALSRLGRDLVSAEPEEAYAFSQRLVRTRSAAAIWLAAAILEFRQRHDEAVAALESITETTWGEERALRLLACARNLIQAGRHAAGWNPLREAIRCAGNRQTLVSADQLLSRARKMDRPPARVKKRVALIGSGSLAFWAPVLRPIAFAADIDVDLLVGEFEQYQQEILSPDSPLAQFNPEVVILATNRHSLGLLDETADPDRAVSSYIEPLKQLWTQCAQRWGASVIQHNFEIPEVDPFGRLSAALPGGRARLLQRINLALWDASTKANVAVLDVEQIAGSYGKQRWHDPTLWISAKQYPAPDALALLARHEASLLRALCGLTAKCVVLDLDNTLWGGIIGEDGIGGIRLGGTPEGESYIAFQRYLCGLRDRGIPLAVCSKNNPEDALAPFREHPEMLLKPEDFAVFKANWEPKPDNLRSIASTLNLGLDSLVFIDDNPVERASVRAELPEVEVPELPADPALFSTALHRSLLFEALSLTSDDRNRAGSYRENAQRQELLTSSTNVEEFLAGLKMRIELRRFDEANLPRIVQLINKTNQFNLTTRRTSAQAVEQLMHDPLSYTQFMRLHDRFGDNGITGILIARREGHRYRIDNWLMSCRVLGRRVEDIMLIALLRFAAREGASEILGEYLPTAKNGQVAGLYERFGFKDAGQSPEGGRLFLRRLDGSGLGFPDWGTVEDETNSIQTNQNRVPV